MKNELFDMYSWLRGYLYIILLMIISSSSFALTAEQEAFGGFAEQMFCSHPSDLNFCVSQEQGGRYQACLLWMAYMQSQETGTNHRQYSFSNNTDSTCFYTYVVTSTGTKGYNSQPLTISKALCPAKGEPPPKQIIFSRQGRWFPQELGSTRCFEKCEYNIDINTFKEKHYAFTNGVITEFKENLNHRAQSKPKLCFAPAEPIRNTEGEVTYDANCDDAFLKVFCEFVEWYRSDAEMPEAPPVENKDLNIPHHLKADHIQVNPSATADFLCFPPYKYTFYLPFASRSVEGEFEFTKLCQGISSIAHILKALYLLAAALIIFRK